MAEMYNNNNNMGPPQPGMPMPPQTAPQPNPFGNPSLDLALALLEAAWELTGRKYSDPALSMCRATCRYEQITRYFSDPQYYFQVNDQYVRNKLKIVLLPFLHRGHWTRISEPVVGRLSYKPPIYDINAPDLYIPLMAFGTYLVLAGFSLGLYGK
ncbi:hypothetical protein Bca52824_095689 [Brassica carinata]|uniref:Uncharacterized protein n=1 Tax=Brassica carinata TaxID=52824 RepID=A0A8X7THX8_BRACI|nr:hypothetical protein Bca52824_095689 [Brassica carinata]